MRDRLIGAAPKDYDIATSARPDDVVGLFPKTQQVGAVFGVVLVIEGDEQVEVATFREDVGIADGRHPESIRFADERDDALRRDFTINGMFEDPETGEVIDHVGGRKDLARRVIRTIGEPGLRFAEDRLRMLRAIRFATVLDFTVDLATLTAIRAEAESVDDVSAERIRDELDKILQSGRGGRGVGLLGETGLLDRVLPEVAALDGIPHPSQFHPEGDVFTHTRMLLDSYTGGGREVALAALLHDVAKAPTFEINAKGRYAYPKHASVGAEMAETILRRLRYPNRVIEQVMVLIARHMDWPAIPAMRASKQRRWLLRDDYDQHAELHRLDCSACHADLSIHSWAGAEREKLLAEPPPIRPLISGHELKALGFSPGPAFGRILEALLDAQLEERVRTRDEAREFVIGNFMPPDGRPLAEEDAE